jgi:formylglycine-generating enzyme required for sulfatase activity
MACDMILGIDDLVADRGGGTCVGVCGTPGCGACPTVAMVDIPHPTSPYRIDAFEVTIAEYQAFVAAGYALSAQDRRCEYNLDYSPGIVPQTTIDLLEVEVDTFEASSLDECKGWLEAELAEFGENEPVRCVDVCDARAYCAWAGKRLCGEIGGDILDVTQQMNEHADPERSEWHRACTQAGATIYPYGDTYEPGRCIDAELSPNIIYNVDSHLECEGGYPGLFHMSGNAGEWDNSCTAYGGSPAGENCLARGGFFYSGGTVMITPAEDLACGSYRDALQSVGSSSIGFRCCADPL